LFKKQSHTEAVTVCMIDNSTYKGCSTFRHEVKYFRKKCAACFTKKLALHFCMKQYFCHISIPNFSTITLTGQSKRFHPLPWILFIWLTLCMQTCLARSQN